MLFVGLDTLLQQPVMMSMHADDIFVHADRGLDFDHAAMEGSALLDLRELRVLGVAGWHIYFLPRAASLADSSGAELALTELHASTWQHEQHDVLLTAALRKGERCCCSCTGIENHVKLTTALPYWSCLCGVPPQELCAMTDSYTLIGLGSGSSI